MGTYIYIIGIDLEATVGKFHTNLCDRKPVLVLPIGNQEIAYEETYEFLLANTKETGVINVIKMRAGDTIIRSYCKQPKRQSLSNI